MGGEIWQGQRAAAPELLLLFGQKRASKHQDRGRKGIGVKAYWWAKFFTQHVATEAILTVSLT